MLRSNLGKKILIQVMLNANAAAGPQPCLKGLSNVGYLDVLQNSRQFKNFVI